MNKKKNNDFVLLLVGIVFSVMSFIMILFQYPSGEATFVTGTVTGANCSESSKGGTTCKGEFRYHVDGKKYEGSTDYSTGVPWRKGEKVTVIASKKDPREYTTLGDIGFMLIFFVVGLSLIGVFILLVLQKRKKSNKQIGMIDMASDDYNSYG